jgi:hypothetical protein
MTAICLGLRNTPLVFGQTPSDAAAEPHHRLLLENDKVRVYAVTLRPAEQSYVLEDNNFLMVPLQDCEMVMWAEGQSAIQNFRLHAGDARFYFGGPARGLRNDRTTECSVTVVEFLNPKVTTYGYQSDEKRWDYGGSALPSPADPNAAYTVTMPLGAVDVRGVQLLQRDPLPPPEKLADELLIPVTDLDLNQDPGKRLRKSQGEILWIPAGRTSDLVNRDADPARFVVVELR